MRPGKVSAPILILVGRLTLSAMPPMVALLDNLGNYTLMKQSVFVLMMMGLGMFWTVVQWGWGICCMDVSCGYLLPGAAGHGVTSPSLHWRPPLKLLRYPAAESMVPPTHWDVGDLPLNSMAVVLQITRRRENSSAPVLSFRKMGRFPSW